MNIKPTVRISALTLATALSATTWAILIISAVMLSGCVSTGYQPMGCEACSAGLKQMGIGQ